MLVIILLRTKKARIQPFAQYNKTNRLKAEEAKSMAQKKNKKTFSLFKNLFVYLLDLKHDDTSYLLPCQLKNTNHNRKRQLCKHIFYRSKTM